MLGVDDGSLRISKLVLNGTDVLHLTQGITRTGDDVDEFALKHPIPITLWFYRKTSRVQFVCVPALRVRLMTFVG